MTSATEFWDEMDAAMDPVTRWLAHNGVPDDDGDYPEDGYDDLIDEPAEPCTRCSGDGRVSQGFGSVNTLQCGRCAGSGVDGQGWL
jgi:hypothetical protein